MPTRARISTTTDDALHWALMIALKHVLVPTDFSETSDVGPALREGARRRVRRDAARRAHHRRAVRPAVGGGGLRVLAGGAAGGVDQGCANRLASGLSNEERQKLQAVTTTVLGHPVMEILRYANENAIDLIVLGTHGRGPLGHVVLGSVAERVVRKAPCPVLTVRTPEREFVR